MAKHAVVADDAPVIDHHAVLMVEPDAPTQAGPSADLEPHDIPDIAPRVLVQHRGWTSQKPGATACSKPLTDAVDDDGLEACVLPASGPGLPVFSDNCPQTREARCVPRGRR